MNYIILPIYSSANTAITLCPANNAISSVASGGGGKIGGRPLPPSEAWLRKFCNIGILYRLV